MIALLQLVPDWAWFTGGIVFAVGGLELFRVWIENKGAGRRGAMALIATGMGAVFLAMLTAGVVEYLRSGRTTFQDLSFFLTGAAGLGILLDLVIRHRPSSEMRRSLAQDL